jgi:Ca2+-binding RTX toxin-like protein
MITTVKTAAELTSALNSAHGGDTILLAPGQYSALSLRLLKFTSDVTVTSLDPSNRAVLTGIQMDSSSNVVFSKLELRTDVGTNDKPYMFTNANGLTFEDVKIHGSLNGSPTTDRPGLTIRYSNDVTIKDSEFYELSNGMAHRSVTNLVIEDNSFHDIRTDGIQGGGSSNVTITGNEFRDFYPAAGDHADAIQFWTTNSTSSAQNILVSGNQFIRGAGGRIQGVFFNDEVGNLPYKNVTITDNLIAGGRYNGVFVLNAENVVITDNVVAGFTDMKSWIWVDRIKNIEISGNASNELHVNGNVTGATVGGNSTLALASDGGAAAIALYNADDAPAPAPAPAPPPPVASVTTGTSVGEALLGGEGHDNIDGAGGADTITDAGGANTLNGGAGDDRVTGGVGADSMGGGAGRDTLAGGEGADTIQGGDDADQISGDAGNDSVVGGAGADVLNGGDGDDTIIGDAQNDILRGGAGDDVMIGGANSDILTGGAGADTFRIGYTGVDRITDFNYADGDRIDMDAGVNYSMAQVGGDVVLTMGSSRLTVVGVQLSAMPSDWII